jgi:hypothetical protein
MIRSLAEIKLEPIRIIVAFDRSEFPLVDRAARDQAPSDWLRELALEKVAADGITTAPRRLQGGHIVKAS